MQLQNLEAVTISQHDEPIEAVGKLPEEMVHQICSLTNSSTLFNVCLASRRLNRIATPVLYRSLDRTYPCPSSEKEGCPITQCLETLRHRPELRSCIKTIRHTVEGVWGHQSCDHPGPALMQEFAMLLGLDQLVFAKPPGWVKEDRFVTLLALLAPNLEHLELRRARSMWGWEAGSVSLLLEQLSRSALGIGTIHKFDKLRFLHVEAGSAFCIPNQHAFPLVLLPRLEYLTLGGWGHIENPDPDDLDDEDLGGGSNVIDPNDSDMFGQPWKWPVRTSPISELSLRYPKTSSEAACNMILACKALTGFSCDRFCQFPKVGNREVYTHITSALHEHRHTLRELTINETWSAISERSQGRISDLSDMTVLKHLRVPWGLICIPGQGSLCSLLPRSIESLAVEFTAPKAMGRYIEGLPASLEELVNSLEELHMIADTQFPDLGRIHVLWYESRWATHSLPLMANLRSLFEHTSVSFDITIAFVESTYSFDSYCKYHTLTSRQKLPILPIRRPLKT